MGSPAVNEPSARYVTAVSSATLVDSCVLIDVLADDPVWAEWSLDQLEKLGQQGQLEEAIRAFIRLAEKELRTSFAE